MGLRAEYAIRLYAEAKELSPTLLIREIFQKHPHVDDLV